MKILFAYILFSLLLVVGCREVNMPEGLNIEDAMETNKEFVFSEMFDSLTCIPLETTDESLLGQEAYVMYADEKDVFIRYDSRIYHFTTDGSFLNIIGKKGDGPGEYIMLYSVSVDAKNERLVYYVGQGRMQYWGYDGTWLGEKTLRADGELTDVYGCGDKFIAENRLYTGDGLFTYLCIYDFDGELQQKVPIAQDKQSVNITMYTVPIMYPFLDTIHYKDVNSDSLYSLNKDSIVGICRFDLGKYRPSREQLEDMNQKEILMRDCAQLVDIQESRDKFYLLLVHDYAVRGVVMDKATGAIGYSKKIVPPQRGGGIKNDMLGGCFWPSFIGADDALYQLLLIEDISDEGEKYMASHVIGKYQVSEDANPVLLKVYE